MNHASLMAMGLMTLALGSAPAAYAKDALTFESMPLDAIAPSEGGFSREDKDRLNDEGSEQTTKPPTEFSSESLAEPLPEPKAESSSTETSEKTEQNFALPKLPLLNLPPFQPQPHSTEPTPQARSSTSPVAAPPAAASPFQFPEEFSETDLYEPSSPLNETNAGLEFESFEPSVESSDSDSSAESYTSRMNRAGAIEIETSAVPAPQDIGLNFNPPPVNIATTQSPPPPPAVDPVASPTQPDVAAIHQGKLDDLFTGDADSLVARTVGSAEGTRSVDGSKNSAYYGHVDPGNGVWNLGSFSYQHGANSPEEADTKQLARLRGQAEVMMQKALNRGITLTLEEKLNGIDLANQAPKAVLDRQGYIDWLAEAHAKGMSGSDAILWARVQSFIDPHTQTWNAPGLGNSEDRITHDQERRMLAIAKALAFYLQDLANRAPDQANPDQAAQPLSEEAGIARLFSQPMIRWFG